MGEHPLLTMNQLGRSGVAPVTMALGGGELITVSGPSGSGKSLFLRAVADLDPNEGRVAIAGRNRADLSAPEWRRRVVYVPAESGWWADTVADHMPDLSFAKTLLGPLGLDGDALSWPVSRLSTGEKQRLSLIRALSLAPKVLLLDEPTSGLDPKATEAVETLIRDTCATGAGAIVVTHDADQAARLGASRHFRMNAGILTREDTP